MGLKEKGWVKFLHKRLRAIAPVASTSTTAYQTIARSDHTISRKAISPNALKVMYRLREAGYEAYLVGGGVRDLLLARQPKDFDVATNATPEQVRHVFRNSRIIGRRFRLVHVFYRDEVIEVSTFRAGAALPEEAEPVEQSVERLTIKSDNTFGTIEEDAWRRDFTINALYYNIKDFSVLDFMHGMQDLRERRLRMIGDPTQRFHEDPVRLLRAIRLAAKLNFHLDDAMLAPLRELPYLLHHVPQARLSDEMIKLFFEGHALVTFELLQQLGYIEVLLPEVASCLPTPTVAQLVRETLRTTDQRFAHQQRLTPGFLFAALLWPVLQHHVHQQQQGGARFAMAFHHATHETLQAQSKVCLLTKRMVVMMRGVWTLQYHLQKRRPNRVYHLLANRYFRAAFDLLGLRVQAGELSPECYQWWDSFQHAKPKQRAEMVDALESRRR